MKPPHPATNTLQEGSADLRDENLESLFKSWLNAHRGAVLKVARAYTLTNEDYQDLAQEILLQVWRSLPQFQGRASAATWAYRVALNTALGWSRNQRHPHKRSASILQVEEIACARSNSAEEAAQRETVERLYAAIRQLPKNDAALVLLYLDDMSYREMADVLGISESNVGVKLNRAKKALAELMKEKPHGS
jgi:RNA polymerase sigma-70 factor, ECF subfamily